MSWWVTSRTVPGPSVTAPTPRSASAASRATGSSWRNSTTFVWTSAGSQPASGHRSATASARTPGPRVVVGQAVDHRVERDEPGGGQDAGLAHAAAQPLALDPGPGDRRRPGPASTEPTGAPRPFDRQRVTVVAGGRPLGRRWCRWPPPR